MAVEWMRRIEPLPPYGDLQRGFANEVADPAWMLSRQWQLGEHVGEDAGVPVGVTFEVTHTPLDPVAGMDPTVVPGEAILEGSALDWWTTGRRIRVGRSVRAELGKKEREKAAFAAPLPEPYGDAFLGDVDGLAAWRLGFVKANHPALDGFDPDRPDFWDASTLDHSAAFPVGNTSLTVAGHSGGDVDWYTADADGPISVASVEPGNEVVPVRLQYPGAPLPRIWQIEDRAVDIGGYPPDRSHLGTALLIELVTDHANDWFMVPVPPPPLAAGNPDSAASVGVLVAFDAVTVRSSFDQTSYLTVPPNQDLGDPEPGPDDPIGPWSLFRTKGLDRTSLVIWPTAVTPLTGPVLDDIVIGVDEEADLIWAVELRANGTDLASDALASEALADGRRTGSRAFTWIPTTTLPEHWHPYRIEEIDDPPDSRRAFVQGLVADLNSSQPRARRRPRSEEPRVRRGPRSDLIGGVSDQQVDEGSSPDGTGHILEAHAVPYQGLRLERRYVLARGTDGRPVLWRQRSRVPLLGGPTSNLRFDIFREDPVD